MLAFCSIGSPVTAPMNGVTTSKLADTCTMTVLSAGSGLAAGVTHVVVHPGRFEREGPDVLRQVLANPRFERIAVSRGNVTLFRLR